MIVSTLVDSDLAAKTGRLIFGPVPSRRLGLSLGLDLVPRKTCTLDCLYCEVCRTTCKTITREDFHRSDRILAELSELLPDLETRLDFITLAGSGEPTLNKEIGGLIEGVKALTKTPVAVLTNGTLFFLPEVRKDLLRADLVVPSLDTVNRETFGKLNRPHPDLDLDKIIDGLITFRSEYSGQLWLEVLLASGINDTPRELESIKGVMELVNPDLVQINTVFRPPAHPGIEALSPDELAAAARVFGPKAERVGIFSKQQPSADQENPRLLILSMLGRRPCTTSDVADSLGLSREQVGSVLDSLESEGAISREHYNGKDYFSRVE